MDMKKAVRWEVFIPAYIVIAAAAIVGIVNKDMLSILGLKQEGSL